MVMDMSADERWKEDGKTKTRITCHFVFSHTRTVVKTCVTVARRISSALNNVLLTPNGNPTRNATHVSWFAGSVIVSTSQKHVRVQGSQPLPQVQHRPAAGNLRHHEPPLWRPAEFHNPRQGLRDHPRSAREGDATDASASDPSTRCSCC